MKNNLHSKKLNIDETNLKQRRKFSPKLSKMVSFLAVISVLYQVYAVNFMYIAPMRRNALHLMFALMLLFLCYHSRPKPPKGNGFDKVPLIDWICAVLSVIICLYIVIDYDAIIMRGIFPTFFDKLMTILLIILLLEATRRVLGPALAVLTSIFILYALLGPYFFGVLSHKGYSINRLTTVFFLTQEGIWGIPLSVSSSLIYLFMVFGTVLLTSGCDKLLIDLSSRVGNLLTAGSAKMAILASSLFGTISGSSLANALTTGQVTIPLMRKEGFSKEFSAAVEASASTGGLLMPPVMGAGAFIMASLLGVPYFYVVKAAILPAVLFYFGVFMSVHFQALKYNIGTERKILKNGPPVKDILYKRGLLLIPLFLLIYLIFRGYPIKRSVTYSLLLLIPLAMIKVETRINLTKAIEMFNKIALNIISVAIACATVGIIIGVVNLTGLGMKLSVLIISLSGGNHLILLFLAMVCVILLGMGLPATAAYVVGVTVIGPAIVRTGVIPIAAHLFVFYFACIGAITPPVALTAYGAASIPGANPNRTGYLAAFLAISGFIIPYIFAQNPTILMEGRSIDIIISFILTLMGVATLSMLVIGYILKKTTTYERLLLLLPAILLFHANIVYKFLGIPFLLLIILINFYRNKKTGLKSVKNLSK